MNNSIYPIQVILGVQKSLEQADNGDLKPHIGIWDMLFGQDEVDETTSDIP